MIFDSDLQGHDHVELRRDRQPGRGRARRRAHGQAARRQGQRRRAALPGGLGEHAQPRAGLSRGAQGAARAQGRERQPVRRRHDRERLRGEREPAARAEGGQGRRRRASSRPNESTTFGMLLALQKAGLAGKIKFIGFDASDKLVQGVRRRATIDGLVLQTRSTWATSRCKTHGRRTCAARRSRSASTPARGSSTRQNLDEPEIAGAAQARSREVARRERDGCAAAAVVERIEQAFGATQALSRRRRSSVASRARCTRCSARTAPARAR